MIRSLGGTKAAPLGLAAYPHQDPKCIRRAYRAGVNYFFYYGPGQTSFIEALAPLARRSREEIIVATGSGARKRTGLAGARKKCAAALGVDMLDVFFAEYIHPHDDPQVIFGPDGVLDQLQEWKAEKLIRYAGATVHDRTLEQRLASDSRVDVLMHRFNMAHRKAATEVFPAAIEARTPVVAFTATRWRSLLEPRDAAAAAPPTAADCYRYCLAYRPVQIVLTAPKTVAELDKNLEVLRLPAMRSRERQKWDRYGEQFRGQGQDRFETEWP
jgi:aryl-alcohol dehydrogenase-like predicted oxidoreductase